MEKTLCYNVLQSGTRCKNKAKYGNYCGLHRYKGPPLLLGLPDGAIYNILRCISNPKDLGNFAQASLRIKYLTACHIENMIMYELPLINRRYFSKFEKDTYDHEYKDYVHYLEQKWYYLLFLAIGGLYTNFKLAGKVFHVNNKIISVYIHSQWKRERPQRTLYDNQIFGISIIDRTPIVSYSTTFETTNYDTIEQFFWKHCLS